MAFLLVGATSALAEQSIQVSDAVNGISLVQQDEMGATFRVEIGTLDFTSVETSEGSFSLMVAKGLGSSNQIGEPNIPVANRLLAIPIGCELRTEVISSEVVEIALADYGVTELIMPVQPSLSKSDDPSQAVFEFDRDVYLQPGFYQLPVSSTRTAGILRGVRIGHLSVAPIQYDAQNNLLRVMTEVTVRVSFDNADWRATRELYSKTYSPAYEGVYEMLGNYEQGLMFLRDDLTNYPLRMVVVADRMFEAQLQPLLAWKTKKGILLDVAYTDEIGTSTTAIKSYVENLYTTGSPTPTFLLIVGDTPQIPTFSGGAGSHVTDLRYCEFTGDNLPEMYYGRWSAQNTGDLQPQIDKTLEYEQYLMPDPSYLAEVTLIAGVDGTYAITHGNGQINYGTNQYFNAAHGITSNTFLYPDGSNVPGASAAIIQTVEDGIGFINYTAHCGPDGFSNPSFTRSDINSLTNVHKYLLAVGNCCSSNEFGNTDECFGEVWLQKVDGGGVGYIGGSNSTYWDEDYWWGVGYKSVNGDGPPYDADHLGCYDGIFHDHGEPVSEHYITNFAANVAGNLAVEESSSSRKQYYWEIYHLMGDPSVMNYMGVPSVNNIVHDPTILLTATTFTVQADPGSYVAVSVDGVLHGAGYVDALGSVDVALDPFAVPALADIVVTAQNRQPYLGTAQIISPDGPYVIHDSHTIDDSAGNNDGLADFGETIVLGVQLVNVGPDDAVNVVATIVCNDLYINITDDTETYGLVTADFGTAYIADAYVFEVLPTTPDGHRFTFDLIVTGDQGKLQWESSFFVDAHAPTVEFVQVTVNDAAGNGNGIFDPGETVELVVSLNNSGTGNAFTVAGTISETDSYVDVDDAYGSFGDLLAGGSGDNSVDVFILSADSTCPMGHYLECDLAITAAGGYTTGLTFNLTVGDRAVFFFEDFSLEQGWTGLGGDAEWMIAEAVGGSGGSGNDDPADDHTPGTDKWVLGNDLTSSGTYSNGISSTGYVYSPEIDCADVTGVILTYYHQLGVESSSYDHAYFEVFDGTQWVELFHNGGTLNESGWNEDVYDLALIADNNPFFQMRWGLGPTDGSQVYGGWNIDDVELKGYVSSTAGSAVLTLDPIELSDSLLEGETVVHDVTVENTGEGNLRVRFNPSVGWLECNGDLLFVDPGTSVILPVTINATGMVPGMHAGAISYTSNDLNNSSGEIPVALYIYPPTMSMPMEPIEAWVESGASTTHELLIENGGPGRLAWSMVADVDNKSDIFAKPTVLEPLGYRIADPDKTGVSEPYYAEQEKGSGGPDAFGYTWIDSDELGGPVFAWVDISTVGTPVSLSDDDSEGPIAMGFSFPYYENTYSEFYVSSNGILTFGSGSSTTSNVGIPNTGTPNDMISVWWDDLDPSDGGTVYTYQDGASGRFIVTWDGVPNYTYPDGTGSLTFQAIIYANGLITLQYLTMEPGSDNLLGATIGIENSDGTDGLQVAHNQAYMQDGLAINFLGAMPWWLTVEPMGGSIEPGFSELVTVTMDAAELEDSTYTGDLLVATNDPDYQLFSIPVTFHAGVGEPILTGDVNGDELVNISDAIYLVDYIFNSGPAPEPMACGDCNCDDIVNITDATYLIAWIFSGGPEPCEH
jgi:hypothetical protein